MHFSHKTVLNRHPAGNIFNHSTLLLPKSTNSFNIGAGVVLLMSHPPFPPIPKTYNKKNASKRVSLEPQFSLNNLNPASPRKEAAHHLSATELQRNIDNFPAWVNWKSNTSPASRWPIPIPRRESLMASAATSSHSELVVASDTHLPTIEFLSSANPP